VQNIYTIIIGAGAAGLAVSACIKEADVLVMGIVHE